LQNITNDCHIFFLLHLFLVRLLLVCLCWYSC
jgi:hypothetical protein